MAGDSTVGSNLIDVTWQGLHGLLTTPVEIMTADQIAEIIQPRVQQLKNISRPFGLPSEVSRKKIESGTVTLRDKTTAKLEGVEKPVVLAISKRLDIDEVEAFTLMRSFYFNEGIPSHTGELGSDGIFIGELVDAITPFYYSERIHVVRVLMALFQGNSSGAGPVNEIAVELLPKIIPDGKQFARSVIDDYLGKLSAHLPNALRSDVKKAAQWAKQNVKEQLVLLELLFWIMWSYASCDGPLVVKIYETAYETNLGSHQANSTLLLDDEGAQLGRDCAALWMLITIEVLELERVANPNDIQVSADPKDKEIYWSSPDSLQRIHQLVTSSPDSQFACTYAAWAFFLTRMVSVCSSLKELPSSYTPFFEKIVPPLDRSYVKGREPAHVEMAKSALAPEAGLFPLLLTLLTSSPFFVTSLSFKTGSSVTDPNAIAYRSVMKGLVIAIVELFPVEVIPDFESLVEVWIALFGRSESLSVAGICKQFWQLDWATGKARRAIFDAARTRFPIQSRPLIRLLRAMTASGFLDTDPLSTAGHNIESRIPNNDRAICAQHVFYYLDHLPTYTQVIPASQCALPDILYEKLPERMISASVSTGLTYTNIHPIKLPGGITLKPRSVGRVLSDGGDHIVVAWQHQYSGCKVLLEFLTDYMNRRRMAGGLGFSNGPTGGNDGSSHAKTLRLEDIGVEMDDAGDDALVTDALDLLRGVIQGHAELAEQLLESLESGDPVVSHTTMESEAPDLVQLTTMILEEALARYSPHHRSPPPTQLITSAMSVLSALLILPKYSPRVWLYIRSTASLFGSERTVGFTSAVLAAERLTGHYTMTMALLDLVRQLFNEASASVLSVLQDTPRLQTVKEEVLMRATRFVHSEIWVEHAAWKYAQLGDRFEISKRVAAFYTDILTQSPPSLKDAPFANLSQAVAEALITQATTSAINPLISSLTAARSVMSTLKVSRRHEDARRLIYMMESQLLLIRALLTVKRNSESLTKLCLLEQALCTHVSGSQPTSSRTDPIEALMYYSKEKDMGSVVPITAMQVLAALCTSLSSAQDTSPTIIGHLTDPEATVNSLVRILMHPYDDPVLRNTIWNFVVLAVDKEPALAGLLVKGQFRLPSAKGKEKAIENKQPGKTSALNLALAMVEQWQQLWEANPQLLSSVLRFLHTVWEHAHEHKATLEAVREDAAFFGQLTALIKEELGPVPDYRTEEYVVIEGRERSAQHEAVAAHAYRMMAKAHALQIIALDIRVSLPLQAKTSVPPKPVSYIALQDVFQDKDQISDLIAEASSATYDPSLHDEFHEAVQLTVPTLVLDHLKAQEALSESDFGDDFAFSVTLLKLRLQPFAALLPDETEDITKRLTSINLNMSLTEAQTALTNAWQLTLLQVVPFLRGEAHVRPIILSVVADLSTDISNEKRSGDMMSSIHTSRLSLLLSLLEVAWFSVSDTAIEVQHFITLVKSLQGIILNGAQPPAKSFLEQIPVPFHRPLLQITYYCARHGRTLLLRPKTLHAQHRLALTSMLEAVLELVVGALRITFDAARQRLDLDLDLDMELLVAVFEQCTRSDLNPSTTFWLTKCQESDVIRASLHLFSQVDLVGYAELGLLRLRKQPLYAPHVLSFHAALASIPSAAERLASEGVLSAYSENPLSAAIRSGSLDVVLPELPGEQNPGHAAYCSMLSIISGIATALGSHGQYFIADTCALAQLYGEQVHRALSWTIGDSLTLPLLEEIEQTVNLFYAISSSARAAGGDAAVRSTLQSFTSDALLLLQQVNYALTHHNHLASLIEPVTADERSRYEADGVRPSSVTSASDILDLARRPFLARLVQRLFRLSGSILLTLINVSRAETVLLGEPERWPVDQAVIVPHAKVVLGEPVSIGTLLEMGNHTLDVLKHLVDRPAGQKVTAVVKATEKPLDVRESVAATRRNLEAVTFYGVTQLAMWLSKPEFDGTAHDTDMEESVSDAQVPEKERRAAQRRSVTLAERLRRGMTGEMAADFQSLLNKATPVMSKSGTVLEKGGIDLTPVLANFVTERILIPS